MRELIYPENITLETLEEVVAAITHGELVAVPTDTVYGIICAAQQEEAVRRMRVLKGREENKPFALFISQEKVESPLFRLNNHARKLIRAFFPGAITLVVAAEETCPCQNNGTVGIRCPEHTLIQEILQRYDGFLANTSLNYSGKPPLTCLKNAGKLTKEVDLVINAGVLPSKIPSTVVDCSRETVVILREGCIASEKIFRVLAEKD
ncbi:MAG: L-threonylcarbamoyladenylate synthase [bacterium]|jgi:L-threonylcarbamoyladenylate synthase